MGEERLQWGPEMNKDERIKELEKAVDELANAVEPYYPLLARHYRKLLRPPVQGEIAPLALDGGEVTDAIPAVGPEDMTVRYGSGEVEKLVSSIHPPTEELVTMRHKRVD